VIALLALLVADVPLAFVAVAVNVYAVPSVKPVKVYVVFAVVWVVVAGLEVIDHEVIEDPPVAPVNVSVADSDAATALTLGAAGTVVAVIALLADEATDVL
jgi:hypothetical protein